MKKQIDKYTRTFRHIYRNKTNCNYTTTTIHHKQRWQHKIFIKVSILNNHLCFQNQNQECYKFFSSTIYFSDQGVETPLPMSILSKPRYIQ